MKRWAVAAAAVGMIAAGRAGADVKAGVDAWGRGDYKRAVEEWRPLAVKGDADAEFNLAQAYKLGRGVPLDQAQARGWFLKAANQGHLQAADNYGLALFENGERAAAVPWLEKSVARGEPRAELVYGTMLFNGDNVPRDYPRAYALVTSAAQDRITGPGASATLAQMDPYLSPADRQRGTELAQRYAADQTATRVADAGRDGGRTAVPVTAASTGRDRPAPPPAPRVAVARPALPHAQRTPAPKVESTPAAKPTPTPVAAKPAPKPAAPAPKPAAPAKASGGSWRVQLGAFREAGNARALWGKVGGKVGGTASYVERGGVTRLQAGPFASKAAAEHACAAAGGGCVVVAP